MESSAPALLGIASLAWFDDFFREGMVDEDFLVDQSLLKVSLSLCFPSVILFGNRILLIDLLDSPSVCFDPPSRDEDSILPSLVFDPATDTCSTIFLECHRVFHRHCVNYQRLHGDSLMCFVFHHSIERRGYAP